MAQADSPDPSADLVPVKNEEEEVDPVAPAPDPKLPTRKDASLKEFLSKMDDYAPIVCLNGTSQNARTKMFDRFLMLSQITTSQKLAFPHHLKQILDLHVCLLSLHRSSSRISQPMRINILEFEPQIRQTQTTLWVILELRLGFLFLASPLQLLVVRISQVEVVH